MKDALKITFYGGKAILYALDNNSYPIVKLDINSPLKDFELRELKRIKDVDDYRRAVVIKKLEFSAIEKVKINFPDNIADTENIKCYIPEIDDIDMTFEAEKPKKENVYTYKDVVNNKNGNVKKEPAKNEIKKQEFYPKKNTYGSYSSSTSAGNNDWTKEAIKGNVTENDGFTRHLVYIIIGFVILGLVMAGSKGMIPEAVTDLAATTSQYTLAIVIGGVSFVLMAGFLWKVFKFIFYMLIGFATMGAVIWFVVFAFQLWNNRF